MTAAPFVILAAVIVFLVRRARGRGARSPIRLNLGGRGPSGEVGLVAAREVRQRLRGRSFWIATALMLIAIAAAIVIPTIGGHNHPTKVGVVGSRSAAAAANLVGKQLGTSVEIVHEPKLSVAESDVRDGLVDLSVIDGNEILVSHDLSSGDGSTKALMARALAQLLGEQRAFTEARLSQSQQATISATQPVAITGLAKQRSTSSEQGTVTIGLILLFFLLSQYGTWTLIGVMEEKASRVVEVLLAAIRPTQLLGGKVLGIGALVFSQAAVLVGFTLGVGAATGSDILHGTAPTVVVAILGWLVLGYAFYSWVFAAAGSMVERQDQVQAIALPITLPLIIGYISSLTAVSGDHASTYVTTLAYLPPTAPFAMPVLVSLHAVSWWQFALSVLITIAGTVALARFAGTVYRRAVLRTGRRVTFREVLGGNRTQAGPPRTYDAS